MASPPLWPILLLNKGERMIIPRDDKKERREEET